MAIELFSPSCVGAGKWIFQATKGAGWQRAHATAAAFLRLSSRSHVLASSAVFRASCSCLASLFTSSINHFTSTLWRSAGSGPSPYRPKTAPRREVVRTVDLGTSINTTWRDSPGELYRNSADKHPPRVTGTVTQISSRTESFILRALGCS